MVKIKICGITNFKDAKKASDLGAYMLGFNFYKKSPRYITPNKAKSIIDKLPKSVKKVGIFVNEPTEKIINTAKLCHLGYIQLHGDESPEFCKSLKKYRIIKALRIKNSNDIKKIKLFKGLVWAILLDTYQKKSYGGTGKTFNWKLAKEAKKYKIPIILAGGIGPDNIQEAIKTVNPYAVDVCTSIEKSPGNKDTNKLNLFIKYRPWIYF